LKSYTLKVQFVWLDPEIENRRNNIFIKKTPFVAFQIVCVITSVLGLIEYCSLATRFIA